MALRTLPALLVALSLLAATASAEPATPGAAVQDAVPVETRAGFLRFTDPALSSPEAAPAVLERLETGDEHPDVRRALAELLHRAPDALQAERLRLAREDRDPEVRAMLTAGLRFLPAEPALAGLEAALADPEGLVRLSALEALSRRKDGGRLLPAAERLLTDDLEWVRLEAVRAFAAHGGAAHAGLLLARLRDEAPQVRLSALSALEALEPGALERPEVRALLADPDPRVARAAARLAR